MRSTAHRQPGAPAPPAERVQAPCRRAEADGTLMAHRDVRPSDRFATGRRPRRHRRPTTPEEPHEGSPSVDPAAPCYRAARRAHGSEPRGFGPCNDHGTRRDHHRRRRRDLVGGRGRSRDPRRHVGEAGGRGNPRAAADRRPGCRAHRLRGPVRRRARRPEGRVCRLRDHRGRRFGLRHAAPGAGADRRAGHGRGPRDRGGPGLSGEHHAVP